METVTRSFLARHHHHVPHQPPFYDSKASAGRGRRQPILLYLPRKPSPSLYHCRPLSFPHIVFGFSATPSLPFRCSPTVIFATPEVGVSTETGEWAMQDFYTLRREVESTLKRVEDIRDSAGLKKLDEEFDNLEAAAADSSLWDNRAKAQKILLALTDVKEKIKLLNEFKAQVEDAETIVKLTEEMESIDSGLLEEAAIIIRELNKSLDRFELTQLLSGPYDKEGAVISITSGAGGTDAQCRIGLTCFLGCM